MTHHAKQLFSIAVQELIAIGEKARKQREDRDRAKHVARPRETRACMHAGKEKQLKLELQTRITL